LFCDFLSVDFLSVDFFTTGFLAEAGATFLTYLSFEADFLGAGFSCAATFCLSSFLFYF